MATRTAKKTKNSQSELRKPHCLVAAVNPVAAFFSCRKNISWILNKTAS